MKRKKNENLITFVSTQKNRQGLEKMEREKQKCAEKERERREHAVMLEQRKLTEAAALEAGGDGVPLFVKSKFVSNHF